jgi:hypothetical protein
MHVACPVEPTFRSELRQSKEHVAWVVEPTLPWLGVHCYGAVLCLYKAKAG